VRPVPAGLDLVVYVTFAAPSGEKLASVGIEESHWAANLALGYVSSSGLLSIERHRVPNRFYIDQIVVLDLIDNTPLDGIVVRSPIVADRRNDAIRVIGQTAARRVVHAERFNDHDESNTEECQT
jgi:hypothetical protein